MARLLHLFAGHDRCGALFNGLIPLGKGEPKGGGATFPLGLVVSLIFLASASATSAVMPKTANVLIVHSSGQRPAKTIGF